ncbi:CcdB family protein [Psychromarinibacter sp. C21-152]|uniref:Toxin CcdB n=1 Tax=Psychromarinibacter sediminicola TaxID=3033385 RepID=A0AAE3TB93_9RHOB|nr:CcdB family protein [Psychromarinibacter sediminicola]MDF0602799.1 CcdB family protein [Psychromarinibacter sediminicola]
MARYDVYRASDGSGYLLDVQTDLLEILHTRVVVPLLPKADVPAPVRALHPVFQIGETEVVMATHLLAAIPATALRLPVANLSHGADEVTRALDMLFHGF